MTPTERLLTILRFVAEENGNHTVADSATIRDRMGDVYKGESGRRMWRRDLRALRERGLIETDLTTTIGTNRRGIRSRLPLKPERLHLTRDEHVAINDARQTLRTGMPAAAPLNLSPDDPRREVAVVLAILRLLEENEDEVAIAVLADELALPYDQTFQLLDVLTSEGVFANQLIASFEFVYPETDESDDSPTAPDAVRIYRGGRANRRHPTRGLGLDKLGFFPYSPAETDERLTLIEQALASDAIPEEFKPHLSSAAEKLSEWKVQLPSQEPMS